MNSARADGDVARERVHVVTVGSLLLAAAMMTMIPIVVTHPSVYVIVLAAATLGVGNLPRTTAWLLFAAPTAGLVLMAVAPGAGLFVSVVIGAVFLHRVERHVEVRTTHNHPAILWMGAVAMLFTAAYAYGPRSNYATEKLLVSTFTMIIWFVVSRHFRRLDRVAGLEAGILLVLLATVSYDWIVFSTPFLRPGTIFDIGSLRRFGPEGESFIGVMSLQAACGFSLTVPSVIRARGTQKLVASVAAALGIVIIALAGKRVFLVLPLLAFAFAVIGARVPMSARLSLGGAGVAAVLGIRAAVASGNSLLSSVFDPSLGMYQRLNRELNWQSAIARFQERPLFGHGLGGYYVNAPGYGVGEGLYAHNIALEILSEMGVLGGLIILVPMAIFLVRPLIAAARARRLGAEPLVMLLVALILYAGSTHDLRFSSCLIGIAAGLWATDNNDRRTVTQPRRTTQ